MKSWPIWMHREEWFGDFFSGLGKKLIMSLFRKSGSVPLIPTSNTLALIICCNKYYFLSCYELYELLF